MPCMLIIPMQHNDLKQRCAAPAAARHLRPGITEGTRFYTTSASCGRPSRLRCASSTSCCSVSAFRSGTMRSAWLQLRLWRKVAVIELDGSPMFDHIPAGGGHSAASGVDHVLSKTAIAGVGHHTAAYFAGSCSVPAENVSARKSLVTKRSCGDHSDLHTEQVPPGAN
jgi:hypothetical protein